MTSTGRRSAKGHKLLKLLKLNFHSDDVEFHDNMRTIIAQDQGYTVTFKREEPKSFDYRWAF
jgi:hypothetical protein